MATSLGTYAELQAAVAAWNFGRTDLPVENLILLGESRIKRDLKLRNQWTEAALTGVQSARTIALPSGFIEASDCWIEQTWGRQPLAQIVPAINTVTDEGEPEYWAIEGETLAFERPLDQAYSITLRCLTGLDLETTSTNWLLTNHPDCYLAASMVEGALYVMDDNLAATWEQRYQAALSGVKGVEAAASRAPLRTEIPNLNINAYPYNYQRGY